MERAILFFDIDGTVLSEVTKEVPQSAIEAMGKARAEGHLLFINTGRTICSIPTEVRKFQFDGYLCGCGTYLTEHDEVLLKSSIEKQRGIELLRKAKECNLGVIAEGQEDCYFPGHISRFDRLESTRRYFASRGIGIEQSLESERFEYDKLFVYVDDKSDFDSFREYLGDDMEALDRGGKAYEVIQKGFSKATACQFIMEKYGLDASRAYVFGDSSNDLAMFEYAAVKVAMGNGSEKIKALADYITQDMFHYGIRNGLEYLGLI